MSFTPEWLTLRAAADDRARAPQILSAIRNWFEDREEISILDIGAGTGASVTLFAAMEGPQQRWRLVDYDPVLLAEAARRETAPHQSVETVEADLSKGLAPLLDPAPDLVTAQAFFDLCSAGWVRGAVEAITGAGAALYASLTYDGRMVWSPPHPLDGGIETSFHVDMSRDKGFGPALGPDAAAVLGEMLAEAGYSVWQLASDWELSPPEDAPLIEALATGTAEACRERLGPAAEAWGTARLDAEHVLVGHQDIFAVPVED